MKHEPKTYEATHKGRKVKVTVPDDLRNPLEDVLKDSISPQATAAVAARLLAGNCKNAKVNRELLWLADVLIGVVGGPSEYNRLIEEIGL